MSDDPEFTITKGSPETILEIQAGENGNGGDIVFHVGVRSEAEPDSRHGRFIWKLGDGSEVIRIESDGRFFIRGVETDAHEEILAGFRKWLGAMETVYTGFHASAGSETLEARQLLRQLVGSMPRCQFQALGASCKRPAMRVDAPTAEPGYQMLCEGHYFGAPERDTALRNAEKAIAHWDAERPGRKSKT